jgi:hypothetical protein
MITIFLSYYNQADTIKMHINTWLRYSDSIKQNVHFIIVDDCSQIQIENILEQFDLSSLNIQIYRVLDNIVCNMAGVKNSTKCHIYLNDLTPLFNKNDFVNSFRVIGFKYTIDIGDLSLTYF